MSGAVAGLVSLPTTGKGKALPVRVGLEVLQAAKAANGFVPDVHATRMARLRRAVGFSARCHEAQTHNPGFRSWQCLMVTATLRDGVEWAPNMVKEWLRRIRQWCQAQDLPCRYVWVAELQKRGAVHYHLALWLPASVYLPDSDAAGWWPHGSTRTERARGAVAYLMKYLSKGGKASDHQLPGGARMYGIGGLNVQAKLSRLWLSLPSFIRARCDIFGAKQWRRAKGHGGWWSPDGFHVPSEFQRRAFGPCWGVQRVSDYGRPFEVDGAFCFLPQFRPSYD